MAPNGVVLYEGPSVLNGEPIVVILTGIVKPSENPKTGPMLQTWILRQDKPPVEAIKDGSDAAICGACPLRGVGSERKCYVNVGQAPGMVWKTWKAGKYPQWSGYPSDIPDGPVRLGSYGDPAAVPLRVWDSLILAQWTGYTHQWRHENFDARILELCMASVETDADIAELHSKYPGARYFRVRKPGEEIAAGEAQCPASKEGGQKTQCARCGLCVGQGVRAKSISIEAHGAFAKKAWGE